MTEQFIIDIDYAYDSGQSFIDTLTECENLGGKIIHIQFNGPGGGNPNVQIQFPNKTIAQNWLLTSYFENDIEVYNDQINDIIQD